MFNVGYIIRGNKISNFSLNPESVVEYMAVKRRTLVVNVAFGLYFAVGSTVLPWIAYYIANWRFFAYVSAVPMMSVFITPWILPESARYDILSSIFDPNYIPSS